MPKKEPKQKSDNVPTVLQIMRDSTKRKEKMYRKVTDNIALIKKSQTTNEAKLNRFDDKFDRIEMGLANLKLEISEVEKGLTDRFTKFTNKLFTKIDPLLIEIENGRVDRELTTQRFVDLEKRIETLEKAAN